MTCCKWLSSRREVPLINKKLAIFVFTYFITFDKLKGPVDSKNVIYVLWLGFDKGELWSMWYEQHTSHTCEHALSVPYRRCWLIQVFYRKFVSFLYMYSRLAKDAPKSKTFTYSSVAFLIYSFKVLHRMSTRD